MKFTFKTPTRQSPGKQQPGIVTRETHGNHRALMLILIIMAIALTACNLPRKKALSGAQAGVNPSGPTDTPTSNADAGGALLTTERNYEYYDPNGSDLHNEVGSVKLVFSMSDEGHLIVEGSGKSQWSEIAQFPVCGFTAKAQATLSVRGLFMIDDCMFHLTIDKKFSQPTTSNQSADCATPIHFTQTEFSDKIILDPETPLIKETKNQGEMWRQVESFKITELKSEVVQKCFKPEVIERSK